MYLCVVVVVPFMVCIGRVFYGGFICCEVYIYIDIYLYIQSVHNKKEEEVGGLHIV